MTSVDQSGLPIAIWQRLPKLGSLPRTPDLVLSRSLQPELLDSLPAQSPDALHSRRDLRIFNRVMGNPKWVQRQLRRLAQPGETVLELGAGGGELSESLAPLGLTCAGLDRAARPPTWPPAWPWYQEDLRTFAGWASHPIVLGTLIFHHLDNDELAQIGRIFDRHARVIVACEPARQRRWLVAFRGLCRLIRANPVSWHDGQVSIAAGFHGDELPSLLGLSPDRWTCKTSISVRGVYRLAAERTSR